MNNHRNSFFKKKKIQNVNIIRDVLHQLYSGFTRYQKDRQHPTNHVMSSALLDSGNNNILQEVKNFLFEFFFATCVGYGCVCQLKHLKKLTSLLVHFFSLSRYGHTANTAKFFRATQTSLLVRVEGHLSQLLVTDI